MVQLCLRCMARKCSDREEKLPQALNLVNVAERFPSMLGKNLPELFLGFGWSGDHEKPVVIDHGPERTRMGLPPKLDLTPS